MKNQIIILGGGSSIQPEKEKLEKILKNKFTIGLNYIYKPNIFSTECTFYSYVDHKFYTDELEGLKSLDLIIGNYHSNLNKKVHPNTIMLPAVSKYDPTLKAGVYSAALVGIFVLSLAIYLAEKGDEIYCLGYDFGKINNNRDKRGRFITHFYQEKLNHRGTGKTNYYLNHRKGHTLFGCFAQQNKVKIYNVGLKSNLKDFEKINYEEFYNKLNKEKINQDKLRKETKNKLKSII